ncbi:16S rRNA (cytosine(1402)-N(4))-methyltransferase RsmH [Veillonella magna]|uniref:Ribosomal RNA small subunit methyltransferase H n=1 Tax=Veillonella magna TaxID=464322 RepID=A0ABS2GE02_9FIRM|nr:16S rRNA (cytosine(1402)-N(4))-methyltransferase RsmH [Veillonella magna]MBM6823880.1 16S rRNA (cytosine(1402)-N(4))-methyltransferase RsmH [Veillonella magna]MBM6912020.1 16S rRNA (cytosine(1402)-N(4))-methyltransferase RsmH [Veillonella magna]
MEFQHVSVLLEETVTAVLTDPDGIYVDCTLGGAGHSHALGERLSEKGLLIGFDQDEVALEVAKKRLSDLPCRVMTIPSNFRYLKKELAERGIDAVNGIIFDLGVSSYQLDTAERGFSYMNDGPLDMRMDQHNPLSAEVVVNDYDAEELVRIIKEYGEERWAKRIVEFIVDARQEERITTTGQLVSIIKKAIPAKARQDGPHPAKRTFQAIRIEVNQELSILHDTFVDAAELLTPGGRMGVITFHSLEDRITKQTFKELSTGCICPPELPVCVCHHVATVKARNKAIEPSVEEIERNPRSRSAKLRVAEKL